MAHGIDLATYSDVLVVLGTAGVVIPLVRRLGVSPVLGYLAAGAVLGPHGLGAFKDVLPALYWVTVVNAKSVTAVAELGVVFLLFLIGLDLSFSRLAAMRRLVVGLGGLQVLVSAGLLSGAALAWGLTGAGAIVAGACLALSSTAVVLELLADQGRLTSRTGRASFSVLLAQDIAVIPLLLFISAARGGTHQSLWAALGESLLQAALALAAIVLVGRMLMRPLFRLVAQAHSSDLFVAAVLFVIIGAGVASELAGLSMALGAFVAGLLLAETEYGKAIEATVQPFKGLLLGLFFFTVGMNLDLRPLMSEPWPLLAAGAGLVLLKAAVAAGLGRAFRLPWAVALETGLLLGPGGEFAFVGVALAALAGLVTPAQSNFLLGLTTLTMVLLPALALLGRRAGAALQRSAPDPALAARPHGEEVAAIVVGYGRVGAVVCELLRRGGLTFLAIDRDPLAVTRARHDHKAVYYGDAADTDFLRACGLDRARAAILTVDDSVSLAEIIAAIRRVRLDLPIVARARDADHARRLYRAGVSAAVPETIEASLQLAEAALVALGAPVGAAIAQVHEKRDELRLELQSAADEGAA